jgi:hypothetical protein
LINRKSGDSGYFLSKKSEHQGFETAYTNYKKIENTINQGEEREKSYEVIY